MSARKEFTKKDTSKYVSRYKKGETLRVLAGDAEVSVTTMRQLLIDNGVTMRARGKVAAPAAKKAKAPAKPKAAATTKSASKTAKTTKAKGTTKPAAKKVKGSKGKTKK